MGLSYCSGKWAEDRVTKQLRPLVLEPARLDSNPFSTSNLLCDLVPIIWCL